MTSQGAGGPLEATTKINAERACMMLGNVRIQLFESENEELGEIQHDDRALYRYLNFDGEESVSMRVAPGKSTGSIVLKKGMPWGQTIATVNVPASSDGKSWTTVTAPVEPITGIHPLWLMFYSDNPEQGLGMAVDWFQFK